MNKRIISYLLMLIGFALIIYLTIFSTADHAIWAYHNQRLPEGELIERDVVTSALRSLQLDIRNLYQRLFIPAAMILIGGILNGINKRNTEQPFPPDHKKR